MGRPPPARAHRVDGLALRRLARWGSVHAPEWFKRSAPPLVAAASFALVGERRRAAVVNLQRVLGIGPGPAHWAALRMFAEFAFCTSEAMEHDSAHPRPVRIDRPEHDPVREALGQGRGAVVVTGHIGSWDIAARALAALDRPVHLVMSRELDAGTQELVAGARARAGVRVVLPDASVFSSLGLVNALRRNELVAIQLDRVASAGGIRTLAFLGAPAPFPSGPFVLARHANAPVIPVFAPRLGRRHYRLEIGAPIPVPSAARDPAALERVMREAVAQLEAMVRRHPRQWFQFAPFWPEAASGHSERGR